jgi:biopolymer transport protein TolR
MGMNAAQVRAKARKAMKRREELIEQEELEGGEINLIPYLDIVTVLMLFLLKSISAGLLLGQLNTTIPDRGPTQAATTEEDVSDPSNQPLKLVISVTTENIRVWSITGLEGTLSEPKAVIPRTPAPEDATGQPIPHFDYDQLNEALYEIASRRWRGQQRSLPTFQAVLQADGEIPYGTIVAVMDAMRCKLPDETTVGGVCYLPDDEMAQFEEPVDSGRRLYDPARKPFHDILFSTGFE